jgi:polyvinyl alcohol dehydrogenase (cytochrome)
MSTYDQVNVSEARPRRRRPTRQVDDGWFTFANVWGSIISAVAIAALVVGIIALAKWSHHDDDDDGLDPFNCDHDKVNDVTFSAQEPDVSNTGWPSWGRDFTSSRYNPHITKINKGNLKHLQGPLIYPTDTNSGVSSTITIDAATGIAYVPDWGTEDFTGIEDAKLYAIDLATATTVWTVDMADIAADPATAVRVSLTHYVNATGGECLTFGDLGTPNLTCVAPVNGTADPACGAYYYGIERSTGELLWRTQVSDQATGIITSSPNVVGQTAYTGLSSTASGLAISDAYPCCDFVGHYYAIDINFGEVILDVPTITGSASANLSGASVWGSAPPVDIETDNVVFGTGNLFNLNDNLTECLAEPGATPYTCIQDGIMSDTLIGVSTTSFSERWINQVQGIDAWNVACILDPQGINCPDPEGPDYDFGSGAVIYTDECGRKYVAAFSKSGILWCFDLRTGSLIWRTYVGTGATIINGWGVAFDGKRLYMADGNSNGKSYRTLDGTVRCDGYWAAVEAFNGGIEWITPAPNSRASGACPAIVADPNLLHVLPFDTLIYEDRGTLQYKGVVSDYPNPEPDAVRDLAVFSRGHGAVIVADGIVWAGAMNGYMYALETHDGEFIEGYRCPEGSIYGSASIASVPHPEDDDDDESDEYLTFGCGYAHNGFGLPGNKVMIYRMD